MMASTRVACSAVTRVVRRDMKMVESMVALKAASMVLCSVEKKAAMKAELRAAKKDEMKVALMVASRVVCSVDT